VTLKRNKQISVRLSETELVRLSKRVSKSGLNREAYLRKLIRGIMPSDTPPPEYYEIIRHLAAIGNNINQLARGYNISGELNDNAVTASLCDLREVLTELKRNIPNYGRYED
jgi:hypothetical protein